MLLAPFPNHDLLPVLGQNGYRPALPGCGAIEGLGVVDSVGAGVEGLAAGQRVAAASGRGTWAEYFVAPARMVTPMPDAIAEETAAQLIAMPLSALMLLEFLQVGRGPGIVQNAAHGAVGHALAVTAVARGTPDLGLVRRGDRVGE